MAFGRAHLVGAALTLLACTGKSESIGPTTPEASVSGAQLAQPAPFSTLEGDYSAGHEVFAHDRITGEDVLAGEFADVLTVEETPDSALKVKVRVVAYNFDECYFDDTMTPSGPHQWRWKGGDMYPNCEVILVQTATTIVITSNWDCYHEFCGHRATLEGSFPMSEREPAGSHEWWQEM